MICPQHDTHIDVCAELCHDEHATYEIRIPIRTNSRLVTQMAQDIAKMFHDVYGRNPAVNIGVQGE